MKKSKEMKELLDRCVILEGQSTIFEGQIKELNESKDKIENPSEFKLGDCVDFIYIDSCGDFFCKGEGNPYKIIDVTYKKRIKTYGIYFKAFWEYTCINKEYEQIKVTEKHLKLHKKKKEKK